MCSDSNDSAGELAETTDNNEAQQCWNVSGLKKDVMMNTTVGLSFILQEDGCM